MGNYSAKDAGHDTGDLVGDTIFAIPKAFMDTLYAHPIFYLLPYIAGIGAMIFLRIFL